ncbi:uncharacterized protein KY384_003974 [Bacidia gigantensis]|uniref:uncharacterized protein n=1 Tax=Bacidia gigantensis TaxID=2732470 RepID=UPI001D058691|nr:uncharacterized protein KY384_003974 [Bacidia gigantensis]KAG8532333.1 hypothetical protein KY384_003974 [Bacidia gigantensis]
MSVEQFPFMRLPLELRLKIYHSVVQDHVESFPVFSAAMDDDTQVDFRVIEHSAQLFPNLLSAHEMFFDDCAATILSGSRIHFPSPHIIAELSIEQRLLIKHTMVRLDDKLPGHFKTAAPSDLRYIQYDPCAKPIADDFKDLRGLLPNAESILVVFDYKFTNAWTWDPNFDHDRLYYKHWQAWFKSLDNVRTPPRWGTAIPDVVDYTMRDNSIVIELAFDQPIISST